MESVMPGKTCPFCGAKGAETFCGSCGRKVDAVWVVCTHCKKMYPRGEKTCMHCGVHVFSDIAWKIPLIIGMYLIAFVVGVLLAIYQ